MGCAGIASSMNIIILAGGLGTRLRSVIGNTPKPIALINGHPFLIYLIRYLEQFKPHKICISIGFGADQIIAALQIYKFSCPLVYAVESSPLGTGGGIYHAFQHIDDDEAFAINGDTFFQVPLLSFWNFFKNSSYNLCIAARFVEDTERYGALRIKNHTLQGFIEKGITGNGWINGGLYALKKHLFDGQVESSSFSFEDFIKSQYHRQNMGVFQSTGDFLDIGIPEDYHKAGDFLNRQQLHV